MNVLNRLVAIVIFLLVLALAIGTIVIATTLVLPASVDRVWAYPPLHHALADVAALPRNTRIVTCLVAAAIGLIMLVLLKLELTIPTHERTLVLSEQHGGEVTIGFDTLTRIAEQAGRDIAGVDGTDCDVGARDGALFVRCRATALPFANAATIGSEVESAVRERLQQTLGKPVGDVKVKVDLKQPSSSVQLR